MYLSRLEIFGFKSFPQKISIEAGSGVTAIVGPNGCGKTNVVDAIRWCLGEQSAKTLRSEKMEDVIFNGTKGEKPLSLAEVSLIFSNEDGQLAVEYNEVSVTRRLFRSGESEYLLNNRACRLKDITDLFLNTGLGADSYSMIEPRMIETILSEDRSIRRSLFEEAAGVAKYRQQKKTAERRLESTNEDLLRLQDIVEEVEKKLRSLKRQSSKAKVYDRFLQELKELDLKLAAWDNLRLTREQEKLTSQIKVLQQRRGEMQQQLDEQENSISRARECLEGNEEQIAGVQTRIGIVSEEIQKMENRLAVIRERRSGLEQAMQRREGEIKGLLAAINGLEAQSKGHQNSQEQASASLASMTEQVKHREAELLRLESSLTSAKLALGEARHELMEALKKESEGKEQIAILLNRQETSIKESARLAAERQALLQEIEQRVQKLSGLLEQVAVERKALEVLAEERTRLRIKSKEAQDELLLLNNQLAQNGSYLSGLEKEQELLAGLNKRYEGYGQGAQHLLAKKGELGTEIFPLAEMIQVEPGYQQAIEAALGEKLQWLAVPNLQAMKRAGQMLKDDKAGKATLIPASSFVPGSESRPVKILGTRGWAADFIKCSSQYVPMLAALLDKTAVVENSEDIFALGRENPGLTLVSLEGEKMDQSGALFTGGMPQGQFGLLERNQRIEQLGREIAASRQELQIKTSQIQSLRVKSSDLAKRSEEVDKEAERHQKMLLDSERQQAGLAADEERGRQRVGEVSGLLEAALAGSDQLGLELKALQEGFLESSENNRDESQLLAMREQEVQTLEQERNRKASGVNALKLELSEQNARIEGIKRELEETERRKNESLERIQALRAEDESSFGSMAQLQQEAESLNVELEKQSALRKSAMSQREEFQKQSQKSLAELKSAEESMHKVRREHEDLQQQLSRSQIELGSLNNEYDNLAQRMQAEYQTGLAGLPQPEEFDENASRTRTDDLKLKLKKLGPINFAAFEELNAEEERYGFLSKQREDLLTAKQDLLVSIAKIDETARAMFTETLEGIKKGFVQIFQRLFIGGEAEIRLSGSEDPLEAELEILATPEGKSMKSITLLSGGEKTLTATALLFGIYLVKPAPFCVLDEIDAPLDDANIQRFCTMLKDFSAGTQFMVITHNKRTMEAADRLYGVTMEQPGISKLVSVKFD
ncbi:chromosome segregation protein SMC [candidate division TA06 bacterium]|uniref:Chromosome partition protein Smc n=1 Tax=candidate division TA06 bacterium TaxID=2250710 RepID=A0A933MKM9_UNCT6|nr:chromosome segregation protein SMC [candidate division TA06 bacterium]